MARRMFLMSPPWHYSGGVLDHVRWNIYINVGRYAQNGSYDNRTRRKTVIPPFRNVQFCSQDIHQCSGSLFETSYERIVGISEYWYITKIKQQKALRSRICPKYAQVVCFTLIARNTVCVGRNRFRVLIVR